MQRRWHLAAAFEPGRRPRLIESLYDTRGALLGVAVGTTRSHSSPFDLSHTLMREQPFSIASHTAACASVSNAHHCCTQPAAPRAHAPHSATQNHPQHVSQGPRCSRRWGCRWQARRVNRQGCSSSSSSGSGPGQARGRCAAPAAAAGRWCQVRCAAAGRHATRLHLACSPCCAATLTLALPLCTTTTSHDDDDSQAGDQLVQPQLLQSALLQSALLGDGDNEGEEEGDGEFAAVVGFV